MALTDRNPLLQLTGISKYIQGELVLNNISFTIPPFKKLAIAGGTGSGKTTLLKIIAGLIKPDAGQVIFEGAGLPGPDDKLIPGHPAIAWLSQHFELRNNYRVEEVLEYANLLSDEQAENLYDICRVRHLLKRRTDQLSGGEKQRVAITRLMLTSPRLLLLDEPYSNLDFFHKEIMKTVIEEITAALKVTSILVSHDPADLLSWPDEVIVMKKGTIIQQCTPAQLYHHPVDEYAAALSGNYNLLSRDLLKLFHAQSGINTNGSVIVRPERLSVSRNSGKGVKGRVTKRLFYGSSYQVEVEIAGERIRILSADGNFLTGEKVWVDFL